MATVLSTLYPPLVDTYMPAFLCNKPATINFSISPYNSSVAIEKLHVSVVDQRTNLSILKSKGSISSDQTDCFINSIWVLSRDSNYFKINSDNTCTLIIPTSVLKNGNTFGVSNYFKVQLRFSSDTKEISTLTSTYLTENRFQFSEWSSVCLIKAIPTINIVLDGTSADDSSISLNQDLNTTVASFPAGIIPIAGNLTFNYISTDSTDNNTGLNYSKITTKDKETLRSYQVTIQNADIAKEEDIFKSEIIYTYNNENPNRIYWLADLTNATPGDSYKITVNCETKNQYKFARSYYIKISNYSPLSFTVDWSFGSKIYDDDSSEVCVYPDLQEDGQLKIKVTLTAEGSKTFGPGFLYIKRATSLDNFKKWELIKCRDFTKNTSTGITSIEDTLIDGTLGSLVRYRYSCQFRTKKGVWSKTVISQEVIYPDFYDILLSRGDKQLAIRYNGQITNMTPVVNRIKIDTLGGKYPKFAENAKMNYKQFQLSGMIVAESDYNRKFLNDLNYKEDMDFYDQEMNGQYLLRNDTLPDIWPNTQYGVYHNDIAIAKDPQGSPTKIQKQKRDTSEFKYIPPKTQTVSIDESDPNDPKIITEQTYSENIIAHDIYPTNNWWWERLFREEAIKWLNDGEPKLFRSMTEGNMVVMLMDINLTPNPQIGRRTYNFSATVYEIADGYSLDVLDTLKIWPIQNDYKTYEENKNNSTNTEKAYATETKISQLVSVSSDTSNLSLAQEWLVNRENLLYSEGINSNYNILFGTQSIKGLKVQFESLPNLYRLDSNGDLILVSPDSKEQITKKDLMLGYLLKLKLKNEQNDIVDIFVNKKGYYQAPSNVEIQDVLLPPGEIATLNFVASYDLDFNDETIPDKSSTSATIVGQLSGYWYPETKIKDKIEAKHNFYSKIEDNRNNIVYNTIITTQTFENWKNVNFDVDPYTAIEIKYKNSNNKIPYIIGQTGVYNVTGNIEEVIFKGRRMFKVYDTGSKENTAKKYNLDEWEFVIDSAEDIVDPKYNHVYSINGINKIYYIDDQWYNFDYDNSNNIGLAKVPVNGLINYKGDIIENIYYLQSSSDIPIEDNDSNDNDETNNSSTNEIEDGE